MKRNLWTTWTKFLNVNRDHQAIPTGKLLPEKNTDVKKLPAEDIDLYGFHPASDGLYLVICKICGNAIKPQSLKFHMEYRHKRIFISKKLEAKSPLHVKNRTFLLTYGNQCKNIDAQVSQIKKINNYNGHRFCPTLSKSFRENSVALRSEKIKVGHNRTIGVSPHKILTQNVSVRNMPEIHTNSMRPSVSYERLSHDGVQHFGSSYKIRKPAMCSISESASSLTGISKQLQIPHTQCCPRASAICTYGMRKTRHGLILCSHRSDSVRAALIKSTEEKQLFLSQISQGNATINKSCSSDSSLTKPSITAFKKNRQFIMPNVKLCDIKDQSKSSVSCVNGKALSTQKCLSKVTILNKAIPGKKTRQSVKCIKTSDKIFHQRKQMLEWNQLRCSPSIDINGVSYPSWRPNNPQYYPFSRDKSPKNDKIASHCSGLTAGFNELKTRMLIRNATLST